MRCPMWLIFSSFQSLENWEEMLSRDRDHVDPATLKDDQITFMAIKIAFDKNDHEVSCGRGLSDGVGVAACVSARPC
jgi:hypothetical protein